MSFSPVSNNSIIYLRVTLPKTLANMPFLAGRSMIVTTAPSPNFTFGCMSVCKYYIGALYNHDCIYIMPQQMQNRYTSIRVDSEVYNSLLSTKKVLEQAYNRKFSLSETIQVVNRLSSETIQLVSSKRRELDEMLDGRGKSSPKEIEHVLKPSERFVRGST